MKIKEYVVIGYYNNNDKSDYIMYDFINNRIIKMSSDALYIINDKILNITIQNGYIQHLSKVYKFNSHKGITSKDIYIESFKESQYGEDVANAIIHNCIFQKEERKVICIDTICNENKHEYYNSILVELKIDKDKYTLRVYKIIGNKLGVNLNNNIFNSIVDKNTYFNRNIKFINNDYNTNSTIENINNKLKLMGKEVTNIAYICINNENWLIEIKAQDKIVVPKYINKIGYNLSCDLIHMAMQGKKIFVTESQLNSIKYNLYLLHPLDLNDFYRYKFEIY